MTGDDGSDYGTPTVHRPGTLRIDGRDHDWRTEMSVFGVASMAWAGFVLLRFLAVPWAARWADAKLNSAGTPTAARSSVRLR